MHLLIHMSKVLLSRPECLCSVSTLGWLDLESSARFLAAPSFSAQLQPQGRRNGKKGAMSSFPPHPSLKLPTARFVSHQQYTVFRENSRRKMVQTIPLLVKYCPGPTFYLGQGWMGSQPQSIMLGTLAEESLTFHRLAFPSQADVKGDYNTHPASKGLA